MLTKQDREEIAERSNGINVFDHYGFYEAVTGKSTLAGTTYVDNEHVISHVILDLCDTSDMVELPRDKDGKIIHIGDTVWCSGEKETVKAIEIRKTAVYIHFIAPVGCTSFSLPELVTHIEPISEYESIARAIEDITHCLNDATASLKLQDIAMALRELGGSND